MAYWKDLNLHANSIMDHHAYYQTAIRLNFLNLLCSIIPRSVTQCACQEQADVRRNRFLELYIGPYRLEWQVVVCRLLQLWLRPLKAVCSCAVCAFFPSRTALRAPKRRTNAWAARARQWRLSVGNSGDRQWPTVGNSGDRQWATVETFSGQQWVTVETVSE